MSYGVILAKRMVKQHHSQEDWPAYPARILALGETPEDRITCSTNTNGCLNYCKQLYKVPLEPNRICSSLLQFVMSIHPKVLTLTLSSHPDNDFLSPLYLQIMLQKARYADSHIWWFAIEWNHSKMFPSIRLKALKLNDLLQPQRSRWSTPYSLQLLRP